MAKKFEIRNSTAEFLTFVAEGKEQGIQVLYKDETVWATQKAMAQLFDCSTDNIGLHLKNIYDTNELNKEATTEKISVVQQEGAHQHFHWPAHDENYPCQPPQVPKKHHAVL